MKAVDLLPDNMNEAEINGVVIRKGSVGAFLANAKIWTDSDASAVRRAEAKRDMVEAIPVLRQVGLFEVFSIRDPSLRNLVEGVN